MRLPKPGVHAITNVDEETRIGKCFTCGLVYVSKNGKYWKCKKYGPDSNKNPRVLRGAHVLIDLDINNRHAVCEHCGPVSIRYELDKWRCSGLSMKKVNDRRKEKRLAMLADQEFKCVICQTDLEDGHLDHDHVTGDIRLILCGKCNKGLGLFNDSPESLRRAADYIEQQLARTDTREQYATYRKDR